MSGRPPEHTDGSDAIGLLEQTIVSLLCDSGDDRAAVDSRAPVIICSRFELGGSSRLTLQELADVYGLTRERVRQLEAKALARLQRGLGLVAGVDAEIEPNVADLVSLAQRTVRSSPAGTILESVAAARLAAEGIGTPGNLAPVVALVFVLSGFARIAYGCAALEPAWTSRGPRFAALTRRRVTQVHEELMRAPRQAVSEVDMAVALNRANESGEKVTLDDLAGLVRICSTAEMANDGIVRVRLEHLRRRADQVARLLDERGLPMHISELASEINRRLVPAGRRSIKVSNLSNQLSRGEAVRAIGRRGYWALPEWQPADPDTLTDILADCLDRRRTPMRLAELEACVAERAPAAQSAIAVCLHSCARFRRTDERTWSLTAWRSPVRPGLPGQTATIVRDGRYRAACDLACRLLEEAPDNTLPLLTVVRHVRAHLRIPRTGVYTALSRCPGLVTAPDPGGVGKICRLAERPEGDQVPSCQECK